MADKSLAQTQHRQYKHELSFSNCTWLIRHRGMADDSLGEFLDRLRLAYWHYILDARWLVLSTPECTSLLIQ